MIHIFNKTTHGTIFRCGKCNKIHIEFGNLNFNFTEKEFREFAAYIQKMDGKYWECQNAASVFTRKIRIPIGEANFCFLLNSRELQQLKELLAVQPLSATEKLLNSMDVMMHLN